MSDQPAERPTPDSDEAWGRFVGKGDATMLYYRMQKLERERDHLAAQFTKLDKPKYSGAPMMDKVLSVRNPEFDAWVQSLPATYWTRYDLSAARIGWEAAKGGIQ